MTDIARFLGDLTFKKAASESERERAMALQREVYERDVGHVPNDEYDRAAHYFVVLNSKDDMVATFRIVGPEQRPFDIERIRDLSTIIAADRSPAVIGRLCVRPDYRLVSAKMFLPFGVLKLIHAFATKNGITDLLLYTYPHLRNFYRSAFFREVGGTIDHPDWGRIHLMHLDLIDLAERYREADQPLARLLFHTELPSIIV